MVNDKQSVIVCLRCVGIYFEMVNDINDEKCLIVCLKCDGIYFEMVNDKKSVIVRLKMGFTLRW